LYLKKYLFTLFIDGNEFVKLVCSVLHGVTSLSLCHQKIVEHVAFYEDEYKLP